MPGSSVTMDRRCPIRRLNRVDFPTFGRPTIAIRGNEAGMNGSDGISLPFCKIAHQKMVDLNCLAMIYSRIIESDRRFENQMIGSGPELQYSASGCLPIFYLGGPGKGTVKQTGEHYA